MKSLSKISVVTLAMVAFTSSGQEFLFQGPALNYTYFDFGYERRSFDGPFEDGDGARIGFSIAPIPLLYFAGEAHYATAENFITGKDIDFADLTLGMGLRATAADSVSIYLEGGLAYKSHDLASVDRFDTSDLGFYLEPGIRVGAFGRLEVNAGLQWKQFEDSTNLGLRVGGLIGITKSLAITADAAVEDESNWVGIGLRIAW